MKENLAALPAYENVKRVALSLDGDEFHAIEAKPGKLASVRIYAAMKDNFGTLDPKAAAFGLLQYDEYVDEARNEPGSHPNIDLLLDIVAKGKGPYTITCEAE